MRTNIITITITITTNHTLGTYLSHSLHPLTHSPLLTPVTQPLHPLPLHSPSTQSLTHTLNSRARTHELK